ncbi:MAG TPA: type IV toxin-antitoxin system AbiEi family antitoxin domain-containing protein [Caldimonas sp.]|nr:type IV toxin-antitoxin system AbiEi family antitoxin domain-containing protein [Caldimonas sp.]
MPTAPSHQQRLIKLVKRRGLVRARDVAEQGIPTIELSRLVEAGHLERVARGVYAIPDAQAGEYRSLAEIAIRVPRGVICLLSALRVHDLGTQAPFEVWLAVPLKLTSPRVEHPPLRLVRMSDRLLRLGVMAINIDRVSVPVFDPARTVVDCFKFRNKVGLDVALEALRDGWRKRKFAQDDLWRYARATGVANVMRPYLESLSA